MNVRQVTISVAVASLAVASLALLPATSARAESCLPDGCTYKVFTGYGPTQEAAQIAVDEIVAQNRCDLYGPDIYSMHGSGWGDTHEAICPG